jgi:hypothetical protein
MPMDWRKLMKSFAMVVAIFIFAVFLLLLLNQFGPQPSSPDRHLAPRADRGRVLGPDAVADEVRVSRDFAF